MLMKVELQALKPNGRSPWIIVIRWAFIWPAAMLCIILLDGILQGTGTLLLWAVVISPLASLVVIFCVCAAWLIPLMETKGQRSLHDFLIGTAARLSSPGELGNVRRYAPAGIVLLIICLQAIDFVMMKVAFNSSPEQIALRQMEWEVEQAKAGAEYAEKMRRLEAKRARAILVAQYGEDEVIRQEARKRMEDTAKWNAEYEAANPSVFQKNYNSSGLNMFGKMNPTASLPVYLRSANATSAPADPDTRNADSDSEAVQGTTSPPDPPSW